MSRDAWRDSATTDVLFPDDLEGFGPLVVTGPPLDADEADTDTVSYGKLARLDGSLEARYLVAPRQLREIIAEAWREDEDCAYFEVLEANKGPADHDPWEFEYRVITNGDPV